MKLFTLIERNALLISLVIFIVIAIGGIVELIPDFKKNAEPLPGQKPYTALQLAGKLVYHKEGCYDCHSQQIRPFKSETDRYGRYTLSGEYAFDRPFLFGSRRIGPDLKRVGARRSTDWHELHFHDAQSTSPGSVMPNYTWLFEKSVDFKTAYADMLTQKVVFHVPYDKEGMPPLGTYEEMLKNAQEEANLIAEQLKGATLKEQTQQGDIKEVVALIAYLNSLR